MKNEKRGSSIGAMIIAMFSTLLVILLVMSMGSYFMTVQLKSNADKMFAEYGNTQGDIGMAFAYFQEAKCNLRNVLFIYEDDPEQQKQAMDDLQTSLDNMYSLVGSAQKSISDKKALEILQVSGENINAYVEDVNTCIDYVNDGKLDEARNHLLTNGIASAKKAASTVQELTDRLDKKAADAQDEIDAMQFKNSIISTAFLVVAIIVSLLAIMHLLRKVKKPITIFTKSAKSISEGDIDVTLPDGTRVKEIDALTEDFEKMIANLRKQAEVIGELSTGNLCVDIKPNSERDVVGVALNKLIHDDNSAFNMIRNASNQISLGSGQIAAASQTLAQGSTEQASAIQQITASVTDIATKTKNNAEQANEVNKIVLETKENVDTGNVRMEEMIAAMNEINDASENIQKIIKVIDDIAFNTNILALNATVEAARAGEQGKGFAVVAEEVRNLAGRSAEASSQTAEMIEDSIHKVRRGGQLAKDTAEALKVVSDRIEDITKLSEDIAKSSNDQASATDQIDQALMQVSQVVQTNSATSEQCASASEELSGQARGLDMEIAKFKLKDVIGNMPAQTLEYTQPEMLADHGKY